MERRVLLICAIGDGYLTYGSENIIEVYYNAKLFTHLYLSADYQFVSHPAYNKDRGPVSVFCFARSC